MLKQFFLIPLDSESQMGSSVEQLFLLVILVKLQTKNINAITFLNRQNKISSRKTNQDKKCMHIDDVFIIHGWQQAFSKYRRMSKILTETTFKALFTTQKPRICICPHILRTNKKSVCKQGQIEYRSRIEN